MEYRNDTYTRLWFQMYGVRMYNREWTCSSLGHASPKAGASSIKAGEAGPVSGANRPTSLHLGNNQVAVKAA